jgi:hypothetical protein
MTSVINNFLFENTKPISLLILIGLWLIVPFVFWLLLLGLFCFSYGGDKNSLPLQILLSFSIAFLISSRYVGLLWGGSDDMPSYFLAYLNYDDFKWIFHTSIKYAKHGDFVFGLYSWFIGLISNHHLFVYYFSTVFITLMLTLLFLKHTQTPQLLLCFIFVIIFFKYFQFQWHLIRSCMAVPVLLLGLFYSASHRKKGVLIFFFGGLIHFSTFALALPLLLLGNNLNKNWGVKGLVAAVLVLISIIITLVISAKLLASFSDLYVVSKILTRLHVEPSFAMFPFLFFFLLVFALILPIYLRTNDTTYLRLFNIYFYFLIVGVIALFVAGNELYRFIMPLFLLYSPLLFKSLEYYKQRFIFNFCLVTLFFIHVMSFSYVVWLNESDFLYLMPDNHPITYSGWQYVVGFKYYLFNDLDFYSGYRQ